MACDSEQARLAGSRLADRVRRPPAGTPVQRYLFDAECALADAPTVLPFGISMLAPVLIRFGTDEQRAHWLPRMLDGTDWWCQGYSEPGAGSDLAALRTTAVRDGDHYIVNGQKTWTTGAHHANMIFCLVRTDPSAKKQQGDQLSADRPEQSRGGDSPDPNPRRCA